MSNAADVFETNPPERGCPVRAPTRRQFLGRLMLGSAALGSPGCAFLQQTFRPRQTFAPQSAELTATGLIQRLNEQTTRVSAWRSTDAQISIPGMLIRLSASVAVQAPRNLRLMVKSPGGIEADLGSNAERFWFWAQRAQPYVLTARHDQVHVVQQRMQIPFEPAWLIEALGVSPLNEAEFTLLPGEGHKKFHTLVSERPGMRGEIMKRLVIVDSRSLRVASHSLNDSKGKVIARAALEHYKTDRKSGLTMPHRIDLSWPQAALSMSLHLGTIEANPEGFPDLLWQLPRIANAPVVDLGQRPLHAAGPRDDEPEGRVLLRPDRRNQTTESPSSSNAAMEEDPPWATDSPPVRTAEESPFEPTR